MTGRRSSRADKRPTAETRLVRRDHPIVLRDDQADARIDQRLLGVEHVERRALARLRLVANAFERARRGVVLADGGFDLRLSPPAAGPRLE